MKKLSFLCCLLICLFTNAQNNHPISEENWIKIVDYTNARITGLYIKHLDETGKLKEVKDVEEYHTRIQPNLTDVSIEKPLSYSELEKLFMPQFGETFKNVTSEINNLKEVERKSVDTLVKAVKQILINVKGQDVINDPSWQPFVMKVDSFASQDIPTYEVKTPLKDENLGEESRVKSDSKLKNLPLWIWILQLISLIGFIIYFIKNGNKREALDESKKEIEILQSQIDEELKDQYSIKNIKENNLKSEVKSLKAENDNYRKKIKDLESLAFKSQQIQDRKVTENTVEVKEKRIASPPFFAGKPTPRNTFEDISNTTNNVDSELIYELKHIEGSPNKANFRILDDKNIHVMTANSPDDYLYRVCTPENGNQKFSSRIITLKEGVAELINGVWTVKEENKATIKFQ